MLHAVIMAGGSGTRFWPASRQSVPKQLLTLMGDRSMIRQTVDRLGDLVPSERTLVVTNRRLVDRVREQLPELAAAGVVGEPCKRDTAACIGLAALLVSRKDPEATMVVMPADHVIGPDENFQQALDQAARAVAKRPSRIATFGIRPTYPAECFGYIRRGNRLSDEGQGLVFEVQQFVEKPDRVTAERYLAEGDYYWNSGIFVWKARTILAALEQRQPAMFARLNAIGAAWGTPAQDAVFAAEFAAIEGISIDYAVMEHATDVVVFEASFTWDDLGGWQSLARLVGSDENGNTIVGRHLGVGTEGTIVRTTDEHLVVTLGMTDCIVVHTPDATLVANKHDEEAIRKVVQELEKRGWEEYV